MSGAISASTSWTDRGCRAALKRDDTTVQELKRLRDEAERVGLKPALSALDEALAAS
jgi:hypothetical protein